MKLNKEFITKVSKLKNEPKWMLEFRLKSFEKFLFLSKYFRNSSLLFFYLALINQSFGSYSELGSAAI